MKKVIISPYSKYLGKGRVNPKNYPWWKEVVRSLKEKVPDTHITQVGIDGEMEISGVDEFIVNQPLKKIEELISSSTTWISVDNFFPHMASHLNKPGVVIFGQSDPQIFGYPININILKDRAHLLQYQFELWINVEFKPNCFVYPDTVVEATIKLINNHLSLTNISGTK